MFVDRKKYSLVELFFPNFWEYQIWEIFPLVEEKDKGMRKTASQRERDHTYTNEKDIL